MSYRSALYGKMLKVHKDKFINLIAKYGFDISDFDNKEDEKYFYFGGDSWRWYTGDKFVDAVNSFIEDISPEAGLILIGEDNALMEYGDPSSVEMYVNCYVEGYEQD